MCSVFTVTNYDQEGERQRERERGTIKKGGREEKRNRFLFFFY
jgi:hypothetical protein